jgi:hypothetical protein
MNNEQKNKMVKNYSKAEGGKPEILLDSEPEKLLACRQFKNIPFQLFFFFFKPPPHNHQNSSFVVSYG